MSSDKKNSEQKPSGKLLIALALLAVVIVAVLVMQNRSKPAVEAEKNDTPPVELADETRGANRPVQTEPPPAEEEPKEPESNAERAYLIEDFRDKAKDLSKYKMSNVRVTEKGITLEEGATNGVVESPTLPLKLPSNMVALLWKEERPDGSFVHPEMAISVDGQNWSAWYPIESTGDDINPLYPNGDPNPNYGYVPGSYVSLGLDLVPFVRYRVNLSRYGTANQSPTLGGIRMYHLDSTLGEGKMATEYPSGPPSLEELQAQQAKAQEEANAVPSSPKSTE